MLWLVPDHLASDFPPDFPHRECDSPRDSQPFPSFALVIEIEPVASRGPCNTVQLPPDGREGFNVFLHGLFASNFMDSVADVPTSAVVRRARDGAIHGIIGQGSEHFSGISKQEPALPAGEERRGHVRRNHGYIHTFFATARRAPRHAPAASPPDFPWLEKPKGVLSAEEPHEDDQQLRVVQSRVCRSSYPNVHSTVTLSMTLLRTASSLWLSRATTRSQTPRRWTGAASVRPSTPASVHTTPTPRPAASVSARRTRPSSTSRATRRVMPDREMSARAARSVMRSSPPASASWASTSKSARGRPVFFSRSASSWRRSVACARSSERHASNPRPPGSSFAVSRSKRAATSGFDFTCIRNLIHHPGYKILANASYATRTMRKRMSMTSDLDIDLDRSIRYQFGTLADDP